MDNQKIAAPERRRERMTSAPKNKWIALLLCVFTGWFGGHKFYEGKIGMGILYVFTFGFFFAGVVIDFFRLLFKPSVYYVETRYGKSRRKKEAFQNYRFDLLGKIISGIGGGIAGFTVQMLVSYVDAKAFGIDGMILPAFAVAAVLYAVGAVLTGLKLGDLTRGFLGNGKLFGLCVVGTALFMFAFAAVLLWLLLKVFLGIDLVEWLRDIFGNKEKDTGREGTGVFNANDIPDVISGPYGRKYRRVSYGRNSSDFAAEDGSTVTIYSADIEVSAVGMHANTAEGYFHW